MRPALSAVSKHHDITWKNISPKAMVVVAMNKIGATKHTLRPDIFIPLEADEVY